MTALYENKKATFSNFSEKLTFTNNEVLLNQEEIIKRKETLYTAMILGNSYSREVMLSCVTLDGEEEIQGRVWAMTDKNIMLKNGYDIPLNCIKEVRIL